MGSGRSKMSKLLKITTGLLALSATPALAGPLLLPVSSECLVIGTGQAAVGNDFVALNMQNVEYRLMRGDWRSAESMTPAKSLV